MGKKKQPFYRIVASDSRRARDGRFLEIIGTYNPVAKPAVVNLHEDKVTKWLDDGAIPSDTVRTLFTQTGMLEKYTRAKRGEDVSGVELRTEIKERKKRTRKMKKASVAKAEEAPTEAKADEAPAEGGGEAEKTEETGEGDKTE